MKKSDISVTHGGYFLFAPWRLCARLLPRTVHQRKDVTRRPIRELLHSVEETLFHEWDPIGINANPQCRDEYDSHAPTICRFLLEGADEYKLTALLARIERDSIGRPFTDPERNRRVVRRLRDLVRDEST